MTIKDVLKQLVKPYEIEDETIEATCFMNDLEPNSEVQDKKQIVKIAIELLLQEFPLTGIGEGGVSLSYSVEAVKERIYFLCRKNGLSASLFIKPKATITRL